MFINKPRFSRLILLWEQSMLKKIKYRCWLFIAAIFILSVVSLIRPDAAENVARAFLLLWGASW